MIRVVTEHAGGGGALVVDHVCDALLLAARLPDRLRLTLEVGDRHRPCNPQPGENPVDGLDPVEGSAT